MCHLQWDPTTCGLFFSTNLRGHQVTWLPCEIEALSITMATIRFGPFIIQSNHKACILTDSKPCVQAFEKLCRGEFSASPRISTFLSTVSRFRASISHLTSSTNNIPSDFASQNALDFDNPHCQNLLICRANRKLNHASFLQDIITGHSK